VLSSETTPRPEEVMSARLLPPLLVVTVAAPALAHPPEWEAHPFQLGARVGHMQLTDVETDEQLDLGGLGGYLRWRVSRRIALEGSLDVFGAEERYDEEAGQGTVTRVTMPAMISGLFHLFPEGDFQLYGLVGVGVAATAIEYRELGEQLSFPSPIFQLGLGARLQVSSNLILDASIRGLTLNQKADRIEREPTPDHAGAVARNGPLDYQPYTDDRQVSGGMLTVGVLFGM
jgi:hypothetical protein